MALTQLSVYPSRCPLRCPQVALTQLSVYPSGFDDDAAAAVLGGKEEQARAVLQVMYHHGLVLYDSAKRQHYLHMAVRAASQTFSGAPLLLAQANAR